MSWKEVLPIFSPISENKRRWLEHIHQVHPTNMNSCWIQLLTLILKVFTAYMDVNSSSRCGGWSRQQGTNAGVVLISAAFWESKAENAWGYLFESLLAHSTSNPRGHMVLNPHTNSVCTCSQGLPTSILPLLLQPSPTSLQLIFNPISVFLLPTSNTPTWNESQTKRHVVFYILQRFLQDMIQFS